MDGKVGSPCIIEPASLEMPGDQRVSLRAILSLLLGVEFTHLLHDPPSR